jgi:heme/copper-type cytochrome/quinol oxidase subunit 2
MSSKFILYIALIVFEALLIINYFSSELIGICSVAAFILIYCCIDIYNCVDGLEKNDTKEKKEELAKRTKFAIAVLLISILLATFIAVDKIAKVNEASSATPACSKTELKGNVK